MRAAFEVDTAAQRRVAEQIRRAADEAHALAAHPGPLRATVGALSIACLVQAATEFVERWSETLDDLTGDARRLADAVDLVARSYEDAESLARSSLRTAIG